MRTIRELWKASKLFVICCAITIFVTVPLFVASVSWERLGHWFFVGGLMAALFITVFGITTLWLERLYDE